MASVPYTPTSDPTDGELAQLYCYHLGNKFLNQQELPFRLANGNPYYEFGQVYESIRVQLHAIPSVPFLNQQDLQDYKLQPHTQHHPICQMTLTCKIPPTLSMTLNHAH
ncbi:hypothetical protein EV426DRAFT_718262 [Tirmania nivea]|nr:hypothetical protein EV426DRAFT_718262 [Tirmania nivea]